MKSPSLAKLSWFQRLGLAIASAVVVVLGFAVASVLFIVLLLTGLVVGGWLWWRLRRLARQMSPATSDFIDGEYTVESERPVLEDRASSAEVAERTSATPRRTP
ncbi:MAG: hypothetical protein IAF00_02230 [Phycisphaerales bacterium]|nr:hypothetical protein [Phycisphaerales bacterium]